MTPALAAPPLRFALVGSPNSGKTTLFNALTGLRAKTGNYPGVTVDRREGAARIDGGTAKIIDLPGTYSLEPLSEDEAVSVRVLRGQIQGDGRTDGAIVVVDATTIERSLPLLFEVLALGVPTCLVLTMVDELKARGGELDLHALRRALQLPVIGVVGNKGIGVDELRRVLAQLEHWPQPPRPTATSAEARFALSDAVLRQATRCRPSPSQLTRRLDAVLLHRVLGPLVFLAFVAVFFQAIFSWATPAMDLCEAGIEGLADWLLAVLPPGILASLLADGVVRGVGAVLVFVPQIALLFFVIFFLEACGYMARAAFVVDRLMGWVGLEGRCFIALLSSYACAVPGILATRTIPSPRDRLATILAAPLTTCSARLPVYALLIGAFVPAESVLGPFTWQGLTLLLLYVVGAASALLAAAVFKRRLLRGSSLPFYQELPPYRFPSVRVIAVQVWRRLSLFLRRAGTVILLASLVLWALLNFPRREAAPGATADEARQQVIEGSLAASLGRAIEPVFAPMGFDWRIDVGLIGSFAAREVMVSTLAQVYGTSDLAEALTRPEPGTGRPPLSRASALALLMFFVYALHCVSTLAVIRRETNGWKWPAFALAYTSVLAWVMSFLTYTVASWS